MHALKAYLWPGAYPRFFHAARPKGEGRERGEVLAEGADGGLGAVLEPGLRVTDHQVNDFGRVGSVHGSL